MYGNRLLHMLAIHNKTAIHNVQETNDDWEKVSKQIHETNKLDNHANHGPLEKDEEDSKKEHNCAS
jgi:hypothetical protein